MARQLLNLLTVVSIVVCWCAFVAARLAAENYNVRRTPAVRTRSWFGTAVAPGAILVSVVLVAVPKTDWRSLTFYAPAVRLGGVAILLTA